MTQTDFWKTRPVFFRNFNFQGMSWIQVWTSFPEIGLEFFEYHFSTSYSILDELSRNRSSSCPGNLPIRFHQSESELEASIWFFLFQGWMKNPEFYHLEFGVHTMKLPKSSEYEIILSGWGKDRVRSQNLDRRWFRDTGRGSLIRVNRKVQE